MRAYVVLLLLTGCSHSAVVVGNASPVAPSGNVNATGVVAAAVLVGTAVLATSHEARAPQSVMAPGREVNEQDCTRPIDLTAGNLRCR